MMEMIADMMDLIQSNNLIQTMLYDAGDQIATYVPIGAGIMFVLAIPRLVRLVIRSFRSFI